MFNKLFGSPKNHPYIQATEHYRNLRYFEMGSTQYVNEILEIIRLCRMAIQNNNNDGDANVLLANAYLLAALSCVLQDGYPYFLARAAATIQATREGGLYMKERQYADKLYNGVIEQLSSQMPDWYEGLKRLPKDMKLLNQKYYDSAINSSSLDELEEMLVRE